MVLNLDGQLGRAQEEVEGIRSAMYPGAVCLGGAGQAPGGPSEILACLSSDSLHGLVPAVLHLGCHAMAGDTPEESRLKLRGEDLPVSRILDQARTRRPASPGGLVALAACTSDLTVADYDEALTLSSAFLAAGAVGVIGARWEVSDLFTALLMFMPHRHLIENPDQSPVLALRAARLWMLDPQREIPAGMPEPLAAQAHRLAVSSPFAWAAFTYHGQ
jgi:CHAT domain-containing protein